MRKHIILLIAACIVTSAGCLARQVAKDGINLRHAVLDMYTDQIMDNLIRARSNMPFVQLKYSSIQATDSDESSATPAVDETIAHTVAAAGMKVFTGDYKLGAMGDRKRIMNFTADPITDENDVYQAYLNFANDPTLFMVSKCPPRKPVHIVREYDKLYFWVPVEAAPAFLDLALKTTFMRGKDEGVIPAAVAVVISSVENPISVGGGRDAENATLVFDKAVPNGPAMLVVDLEDGRKVRFNVWPVDKDSDGKRIGLGQPTTQIDAQWSPIHDGFEASQLLGRHARYYSRDYPPEAPVPSPILQQINTNLNSIRVQSQQQRAVP